MQECQLEQVFDKAARLELEASDFYHTLSNHFSSMVWVQQFFQHLAFSAVSHRQMLQSVRLRSRPEWLPAAPWMQADVVLQAAIMDVTQIRQSLSHTPASLIEALEQTSDIEALMIESTVHALLESAFPETIRETVWRYIEGKRENLRSVAAYLRQVKGDLEMVARN